MAYPRRRQSRTRTARRGIHDRTVASILAICLNYGEWYIHHTVCGTCDYYRGELAVEKEAAV